MDSSGSTITPDQLQPPLKKKKWNKNRLPGVNDVRNKVCWICREDEASELPRRRKWVHACGCSLVAHQSCLLLWMAMQPPGPDVMKCPQCKTAFEITSPRNKTLSMLEFFHKQVSRGARFTSVLVLTASILGLSTSYGFQCLRWFVGRDVANLIVGGEHPRNWRLIAFVQLPLIPFSLLLSHTRAAFLPVLPFILATPLNHQPSSPYPEIIYPGNPIPDILTFPPSPPLLLALFPMVRHVYRQAHSKVVKWLVRDHLGLHVPPASPGGAQVNDAAPGPVALDEHGEPIEWGFEQNVREMAARELDRNEPITVDMDVIARTFVGNLMLPPLSALFGEVLRGISNHSAVLKSFLGIRDVNSFMDSAGVAGLNLDGAFIPAGLASMMKIGLGVRRKTYADFDPVWWRNAIGLSLFIVARDAFSLWRKYLTVNNDKRRLIANKPFVNVDYDELDLIID
ncbi:hypothetical protein M407DRAFT_246324 [Tulasnella calospora MUT 4182]|uniref:RING-CH-type domain-containing protein n=1 Tax=Tulasnella calospora MUT 4182 TaxID=1051891 RepID=A0A0C3PVM2_9AGAM|nr:hypothetical protein M407DRAFT_246324 [Tulasnella calospora MUT 4182]